MDNHTSSNGCYSMVMFVFREGMCFFYEDHAFPRRIFVEASTVSKPEMQPIFEFLESRWIIKQLLWKVFSSESDMFFIYHARNCVFLGRFIPVGEARDSLENSGHIWDTFETLGARYIHENYQQQGLCFCLMSRRFRKCEWPPVASWWMLSDS